MPDGSSFRRPEKPSALNVLGGVLESCSLAPLTGWFRDGCCNTDARDIGLHTVCAVLTAEFLEFSRSVGNDLSTPRPEYGFPGLAPGQSWCLCAGRWEEARQAGHAPLVNLAATHAATLAVVRLEDLQAHAA
ncbi:MAG: DUF2237 family protein [Alphaproteobacteria bacterium]|jgi:uncharacterized protein (DUF2237 family)|uniref:DUF2237 family protein n=1 Tax=Rhodovarius sp. TaxID=2972673 RepID=UPI00333F27EA|nr:DUF2237 family protein [Alphaproteobacteria bacterium]